MNAAQKTAAVGALLAFAEAIRTLGSVPSGVFYARRRATRTDRRRASVPRTALRLGASEFGSGRNSLPQASSTLIPATFYYAATFSRPAKHVRGNLFSAEGGREAIGSAYGIRMLR